MTKLYIYPKKGEQFSINLKDEMITFGRSQDADISIMDPYSSGHHTYIYSLDSEFIVGDNKSKNGTFVNGKKIHSEEKLKTGDEILVGSTRMIFNTSFSQNRIDLEQPSVELDDSRIRRLGENFKKVDISTMMEAIDFFVAEPDKKEMELVTAISEVSKALIMYMPLNELLEHILNLCDDNIQIDRNILLLREEPPVKFLPKVVHINNENLKTKKVRISQNILNYVLKNHSSILIPDLQSDSKFKEESDLLNIKSAMCVPLWNGKEIIGIIYADRIVNQDPFSENDLKLLTLFSNLAAIKIENVRLTDKAVKNEMMEKELRLAAQIQIDFLPKENPKSESFEIAGSIIPCYQVGGDYYDFISIDQERIGITIADVSGKGVSASLLMAALRAALQSEVHLEYDIEKMVMKLNNFVHRSSGTNKFITFFYSELNQKTSELKYINAGHNPPLIIDPKGNVRRLESSGFCLGMFPNQEYKMNKIDMKIGDIAVLFTDGIIETRNKNNEEFTEERFIILLKNYNRLSAYNLTEKIKQELEDFSNMADIIDDRTLVAIKRVK